MESLFPIEINFTLFLQSLGEWLATPFKLITSLGNEDFYILIMPMLFWCINSIMGVRAGVMLLISGGIKDFLKVIIHTPRPYWVDTRVKAFTAESSFGMPSGHSMDAASIWGIIAASQKRRWVTWLAILLIFLIGLSRIYLGVHFLHDVVSGWIVGGLLLWGYLAIEKPVSEWLNKKTISFQVISAFLFSLLLIGLALLARTLISGWQMPADWALNAFTVSETTPDPLNLDGPVTLAGVAFGFLGGLAWWIKKYGIPQVGKKSVKLILRYFVGMIGVAILYVGLKMVFPSDPDYLGMILRYIRYALVGVWVTAGAPLIFKKLNL